MTSRKEKRKAEGNRGRIKSRGREAQEE